MGANKVWGAASTTRKGVSERATQAEVDAGTDTSRHVTPETLAAYSGLGGGSLDPSFIPAAAFAPRAADATGATAETTEYATNDINIDYWLLDGAADEAVQAILDCPVGWGGTATATAMWDAASGGSATEYVKFGVRMGALGNDEAIDTALGTQITVEDQLLAVGDLHVSAATGTITAAGGTPADGQLLIVEFERVTAGVTSTAMGEDVKFIGLTINWI